MNKLTVFIENNHKEFTIDKRITTTSNSMLFLKSAIIYWNYKNIISRENNFITKNDTKLLLPVGYLTFDDIKKELTKHKIELDKLSYTNKCKIFCKNDALNLKNFGLLLGFTKDKKIPSNTWTESENECDINNGLRYVSICCDAVNKSLNFNPKGEKSSAFITLPIITNQSLVGSIIHYKDIESEVTVYNGIWEKFTFDITTNLGAGVQFGSVLLELYIR